MGAASRGSLQSSLGLFSCCSPLPPLHTTLVCTSAPTSQGHKHVPGSWRAWRISGVLLELSAWSATQPHCLVHHATNCSGTTESVGRAEAATPAEALARLRQQLDVRQRARQQAIQDQQRRQQRAAGKQQGSTTSNNAASDASNVSFAAADRAQTGAVWLTLLLAASWLLLHDVQLVALAAVAGAGFWWLLQSDGAVAALAAQLAGNSVQSALVSSAWGGGGGVSTQPGVESRQPAAAAAVAATTPLPHPH